MKQTKCLIWVSVGSSQFPSEAKIKISEEPQVQSICNNIRPDRQTLLFSATFPQRVEQLALRALDDPIKIVIGNAGEVKLWNFWI